MTRAGRGRGLFLTLCLLAAAGFAALGVWQLERRAWKLDLIAKVEARLRAPPIALPSRTDWPTFYPAAAEYRRVRVSGRFLHDRETLVDALTERGGGFWVITPLRTNDGIVLINRGFVPSERRTQASRAAALPTGTVGISGLLRASEPEGRILRSNRPAEDRWYSRDVAAIARRRGLAPVAPFFVDADAIPNPGGYPVGGLTVVSFRNAHLAYALTWFALAGLALGGAVIVARRPRSD